MTVTATTVAGLSKVRCPRLWKQLCGGKIVGKVKSWLMRMEEDAEYLPRDAWVYLHGEQHVDIWDEIQQRQAMERIESEYGEV